MIKRVGVFGLGNFGFALLHHLDKKRKSSEYTLSSFTRNLSVLESLETTGKHPLFPDASPLSQNISYLKNYESFFRDVDYLVLSVPSSAIIEVIMQNKPHFVKPFTIINTAKALNIENGEPLSRVLQKVLTGIDYSYSFLSGATIAKDIVNGVPLGMNVASEDGHVLEDVSSLFQSETLRVYPTTDLIGVEYAAAFKNVVSIFSGLLNGLQFERETEIFGISRLAYEIETLITTELGGNIKTFTLSSPCWGNDVWLSCVSNTRNRNFGKLLSQKKSVKEAFSDVESKQETVEGVVTISILRKLTSLHNYPYLQFIHDFFNDKVPLSSVKQLLLKP